MRVLLLSLLAAPASALAASPTYVTPSVAFGSSFDGYTDADTFAAAILPSSTTVHEASFFDVKVGNNWYPTAVLSITTPAGVNRDVWLTEASCTGGLASAGCYKGYKAKRYTHYESYSLTSTKGEARTKSYGRSGGAWVLEGDNTYTIERTSPTETEMNYADNINKFAAKYKLPKIPNIEDSFRDGNHFVFVGQYETYYGSGNTYWSGNIMVTIIPLGVSGYVVMSQVDPWVIILGFDPDEITDFGDAAEAFSEWDDTTITPTDPDDIEDDLAAGSMSITVAGNDD
ncbi:MAG: hypothetical protein AB8H79_08220 [Myxococcota bacterium]